MLQHHFLLSPTPPSPSSLTRRNSPIFVNPSHPTSHLFLAEHQNPSLSLQHLLLSKQIKIDYQQILKSLKQKSLNLESVIFYPSFLSYPFFFSIELDCIILTAQKMKIKGNDIWVFLFLSSNFFFYWGSPKKVKSKKMLIGFSCILVFLIRNSVLGLNWLCLFLFSCR